MNNDYIDVTIVLDRSGSMSSAKNDTIGGMNEFITTQQKIDGKKICLTIIQFDDPSQTNWYEKIVDAQDVKAANLLTDKSYQPRGGTALLDAMGMAIVETGKRFSEMKEEDRPASVIFAVMTDGEENSSSDYTREKVLEMIQHQTDTYKWAFLFLGANQDAINAGRSYGISAGNCLTMSSMQGCSGFSGMSGFSGYAGRKRVYATAAVSNFVARVATKGLQEAIDGSDAGGAFLQEDYAAQDAIKKENSK